MADWFTENAPPTPDEAQMLAQIRAREAGGDYSARNPKPGSTASGAYQFTSSTVSPTWQLATKATGVPAYPSAAEAPPAIQDANALYMLRKHGPNATITWAASGPYKQPRSQGGANRAQDDGQPASSGDVLSRLATGDVSPDELAQYLQPAPQAPSPAPAVQPPAPAGPVQPGDWFAKNAPPPKPPAPPPPSALDEAQRLGSIVAGSSGVTAVKDILAGGTKAAMDFLTGNPVNPQDVRQFKSAAGGILGGISGEPERMRQELIKSGDAMLHGDINTAADHLWFSLPFAGAAGERMAQRLKSGDIKGAFADAVGSLIPFAAEPAISGTKAAIEAAPEVVEQAKVAVPGALKGAGQAAIETQPITIKGQTFHIPTVVAGGAGGGQAASMMGLPRWVGTVGGAAAPIVRGAIRGAREALADRATIGTEAPAAAAEVLPQLQLGPGPIVTPPPPDPSFVRAVPAQYAEVEPGFQPPAAAAPPAPALSFDDLAASLTGKSASRLTAAERANVQNVYDRITKGLSPEEQPPPATPPVAPATPQAAPAAPEPPAATQEPSAAPVVPEAPQTLQPAAAVQKLTDYVLGKKIAPHMIDRLPPEYWQMIADDAGTAVPTLDEIAQIKANVAAKAVVTPVQGEQVFETQKARIEEGMTPPKETPQEPPNYPPHYEYIRQADSKMAAERAFLKDQRVADYLLSRKPPITPEEFEGMTLEEQNKLILEAPAKSAKGKHLPFLPKPEGAKVQAVGRWAEEGIRDIADTMRWRQAQTPAAPEPAAIPTEGLENTPIAGKAAPTVPGTAGGISETLQTAADAALERMRQRGTLSGSKLSAGIPVDDLADMAVWGAAKLAKGTVEFAKWSKEILKEAGPAADQIKPHLEALYQKAQKIYQSHVERTEGKLANTRELLRLYAKGEAGKDWYRYTQGELEQHFAQDAPLFVDMLAVTSPNASVASNVALALKAYSQFKSGQPFSGFMPAVIENLEKVVKGESPGGPKVSSFKKNLFGDPVPVTVDRWMARAMGWKTDSLTPAHYKFIDYALSQIANDIGVEPRQLQAGIWKAIKEERGIPGQTAASFEELLKRRLQTDPALAQALRDLRTGTPVVPLR